MNVYGVLSGTINGSGTISGVLSSTQTIEGSLTIPSTAGVEKYEGAYTFTPTEETQVIEIENKRATANITINPVPSNYGLITWDGITLMVS